MLLKSLFVYKKNKLLFFFSTKVNGGRMFTVLQNSATIHLNFTIKLKAM